MERVPSTPHMASEPSMTDLGSIMNADESITAPLSPSKLPPARTSKRPQCPRQCPAACNRCCCRCCGPLWVRLLIAAVTLIIVIWAICAIVALVDILKLQNAKVSLVSVDLGTANSPLQLCDTTVPFAAMASVNSPSHYEVRIESLTATMRYVRGSASGYPASRMGDIVTNRLITIGHGDNTFLVAAVFQTGDIGALATVLSGTFNSTRLEIEVDVSAEVLIPRAFWFPIRKTIATTVPLVLNEAPTETNPFTPGGSSGGDESSSSSSSTPPTLMSIGLDTSPAFRGDYGLRVISEWTIYGNMTEFSIHMNLPLLYADAVFQGQRIGMARVNPFTFGPVSDAQIEFLMNNALSGSELAASQAALAAIINQQDFQISVQGSPTRPASASYCMIQAVVDAMPPVTFSANLASSGSSSGNSSSEGGGSGGGGSSASTSAPFEPRAVELLSVTRTPETGGTMQLGAWVRIDLRLPFALTGQVSELYLDLLADDQVLGYALINTEALAKDVPLDLFVNFVTLAERKALDMLLDTGSMDQWNLWIRGRTVNTNLLSSLLAGLHQNITTRSSGSSGSSGSSSSDTAGTSGANTLSGDSTAAAEASSSSFESNSYALSISSTDSDFRSHVRVIYSLDQSFAIYVPALSMQLMTEGTTGDERILDLSTTELNVNSSHPVLHMNASALFSVDTAESLGRTLKSFLDNERAPLVLQAQGQSPSLFSNKPVTIDVRLTASLSDFENLSGTSSDSPADSTSSSNAAAAEPSSSSSSSSSSPASWLDSLLNILPRVEPLTLLRDDAHLNATAAVIADWPIDVTGELPALRAQMKDIATGAVLAEISTLPVLVAANQIFMVVPTVSIRAQEAVRAQLLRKEEATSVSWVFTGVRDRQPLNVLLSYVSFNMTPPALAVSTTKPAPGPQSFRSRVLQSATDLGSGVDVELTTSPDSFSAAARYSASALGFSLSLPALRLGVLSSTSTPALLELRSDAIELDDASPVRVGANATLTAAGADALGQALHDIFIDELATSLTLATLEPAVGVRSGLPIRISIRGNVTKDTPSDLGLTDSLSSGSDSGSGSSNSDSSTSSSSSSSFELGDYVTALFAEPVSASLDSARLDAQLALSARWTLPITGCLPRLAAQLQDATGTQLFTVSNVPFCIASTDSVSVTRANVHASDLGTVYDALYATTNASATWTITALRDVHPLSTVASYFPVDIAAPSLGGSSDTGSTSPSSSSSSDTATSTTSQPASDPMEARLAVRSTMQDVWLALNATIYEYSAPMDVVVGALNADLYNSLRDTEVLGTVYLAGVQLPSNTSHAQPAAVLATANVHADDATHLRIMLGDWLTGQADLPLRIVGTLQSSFGAGVIDLNFTMPATDLSLNDSVVAPLSSSSTASTASSSTSSSSSMSSIGLVGVHPLGTGTPGQTIQIPCLMKGLFCPYDTESLSATSIQVAVDVSFNPPFPFTVTLESPLTVEAKVYQHTKLVAVSLNSATAVSGITRLVALGEIVNLPLLHSSFADITGGLEDFPVNIGVSRDTNLLSTMLSNVVDLRTAISPPMNGTSVSTPSGGFNSTSRDPQGRPDYSFDYALAATTTSSATVNFTMGLRNPMSFAWSLNDVHISGQYQGVEVVNTSFPFILEPGYNTYVVQAMLHGEEPLDKCAGAAGAGLASPSFCKANQALSKILSKEDAGGVPADIFISFANVFGQPVKVHVPLAIYSQDTTIVRAAEDGGTAVVEAASDPFFEVQPNMLGSGFNLATSIFSSTFDFEALVLVNNPVNFQIIARRVGFDLVMRDYDGVDGYWFIPGTPWGPDIHFMLSDNYRQTVNLVVPPSAKGSGQVSIPISNNIDAITRLYDDAYTKNKLCVDLRDGIADLEIKYGSDPTLVFTQMFAMYDMSAVGTNACPSPPPCQPYLAARYALTADDALYQRNGQAAWTLSTGIAQLAALPSEIGNIYRREKQYVKDSWQAYFAYSPVKGATAAHRGDGLSFIVQNGALGLAEVGTPGGFGCEGIVNAICVVLNQRDGHIRVRAQNGTGAVTTLAQVGWTLDDDGSHYMTITYSTVTSQLFVKYDFATIITISNFKMQNYMTLDPTGRAWVGVGASTSATTFSSYFLTSWTFSSEQSISNQTIVLEANRWLTEPNTIGTLTLDSRNSCRAPRRSGGDAIAVRLTNKAVTPTPLVIDATAVTDLHNGLYTVTFVAPVAGTWHVSVRQPSDRADVWAPSGVVIVG